MKKIDVRSMTATAVFGALGFVLMMLEFGVPIVPSFIKFDFSELPALIAAFAFGPWHGVLVCFVKNVLHLFVTNTAGVGELANFLMGVFFVVPAGFIYRHHKSRRNALIGALTGAFVMGAACVLINYFIVYPIYYQIAMPKAVILAAYQDILPAVDSIFKSLLIFNFPFTLVKGLADTVICTLIYKKISPILKK
ncbi:MAG: ECF transporter S component [Clostridia bacterium]|nr:ECF transporter S component [Clostridia bacterium]